MPNNSLSSIDMDTGEINVVPQLADIQNYFLILYYKLSLGPRMDSNRVSCFSSSTLFFFFNFADFYSFVQGIY